MPIQRIRYSRKYKYGDEIDWSDPTAVAENTGEDSPEAISARKSIAEGMSEESAQGVKAQQGAGSTIGKDIGSALGEGGGKAIGETAGGLLGSFAGPLGSVVGGLLGGAVDSLIDSFGGKSSEEEQAERAAAMAKVRATDAEGRARFINYDQGSNQNQIAKFGGPIKRYKPGGQLVPLSSESVEVQGQSHEQGGVNLGQGVEVEGGETIKDNYVFSEELGFAKIHKPIARAIGRLEKKPSSIAVNNSLRILKQKEEALEQQQESVKEQFGLEPITREMGLGGEMGPPKPDRRKQLAEAYAAWSTSPNLDGSPRVAPFVPIDEKDPIFDDETKFNQYYRNKGKSLLPLEEQQQFNNYDRSGRSYEADNLLRRPSGEGTERGGTMLWKDYQALVKGLPKYQVEPTVTGTTLPVRREISRVGFNRGRGKLGFRQR